MSDTIHTTVAGAGYVGKALIEKFLGAANVLPEQVTAVVNTRQSAAELKGSGINVARCELDQPLIALDLPSPCRIVYLIPPSRFFSIDYRLENFLDELPTEIRRFVYVSTTGVYGDHKGRTVDETTATNPGSSRSARRVSAERQVKEFCAKRSIPFTIFRVPGIYGPGRLPLAALQRKDPVLALDKSGPGNRIHRDDLVSIIQYALENDTMNGIINAGDGNPMSSTEFKMHVARLAGLEEPPQVNRDTLQALVTVRQWSFMRESRHVDTALLQSLLPEPLRYADPKLGIEASLKADW